MLELFYEEKDLVITPTRYPKPVNQVAENITVIYSEDIEAMNAHTVSEVLRWIAGIHVNSSQDFGASALVGIQGSEDRHVTVLLDGIRWNYLAGGNAETNTIPVGIIDRIEIIMGPASSSWGSSLGGVINIITKPAAGKELTGQTYTSYGEANSLDANAQVSGGGGKFGYYLYAGKQKSDGLLDDREMDSVSLYSKFNVNLPGDSGLNVSAGYSEPENHFGSFPSYDFKERSENRTVYGNTALDIALTESSMFALSGFYISRELTLTSTALGLGYTGPEDSLSRRIDYEEKEYGASANLVWDAPGNTLVVGAEASRGDLDQTVIAGDYYQYFGQPAVTESHPDIFSWALYLNDTLPLGLWALTPGIRLDHNSVSGSFFSPSLGITFQPADATLFRGTISRGFNTPALSFTGGGGIFLDPNPGLEDEEIWSYQVGFETTAIPMLRVKSTLFLHEVENSIIKVPYGGSPPAYNDIMLNSGSDQRRGIELDIKSESIRNVSMEASGNYIHFHPESENGASEVFIYNLIFSYNNPDLITARLAGHFEDMDSAETYRSNFDNVIWDFNSSKAITIGERIAATIFLRVHNLFNGNQYSLGDTKNPSRWFEGGIRLAF
jgi:vitamin B12 transporter